MRGEAVILVVTAKHADLISQRFEQEGYEVAELLKSRQLVIADAEDLLATFFLDEQRFNIGIGSLIDTARAVRGHTRSVRVFDEMVDLIWISNLQATLRLEVQLHLQQSPPAFSGRRRVIFCPTFLGFLFFSQCSGCTGGSGWDSAPGATTSRHPSLPNRVRRISEQTK